MVKNQNAQLLTCGHKDDLGKYDTLKNVNITDSRLIKDANDITIYPNPASINKKT
jgi:hypothetical protein